jgi:tetratricopeptide (TPR) repeat protein
MPWFPRLTTRLGGWWRSRNPRLLFRALPAVVLGTAALSIGMAAYARREAETTSLYLEEAKGRFKAQDYAGAMTCYDRLAHLGGSRPEVLFGLALTAQAQGEQERATLLMTELAPPDRRGYGEAHLWWARRLLSNPSATPPMQDAAERHLLNALDGELEDPASAHGLLGEFYLNRGKLDQAETHLLKAVREKPQLRLRLAQLYATRGNKDRARSEAELARNFFRAGAQHELHDHQARLRWADALLLLGDQRGAVEVLREGLNATGDAVYRPALARVYVAWSDSLGADARVNPGDQLALLEKALEYDPTQVELTMRLWAFTKFRGEAAEKARTVLRTQLASGKATGLVYLALGMDAWERGKADEALVLLEQAYRLAPQMGLVVNNLAWVLANSQPPDLSRALSLMDSLLSRWPNEPMYRDTRGQIYARSGRWREALTDLQAALPAYAADPQMHRRLADVYEHLGLAEMAAEHGKQAALHADKPPSPSPRR